MSPAVQNVLSLLIVAAAALYLLRRFGIWPYHRGDPRGCGACGNCAANKELRGESLVSLDLPQRQR